MALFKPAKNQTAYAKIGVLGFAGTGKTYTSCLLGIGMAQRIGSGKPVMFFDTETGSDFMIPVFKEAGVKLNVAKTRAFSDLKAAVKEAEKNADILIIDSISHVWIELQAAYKKRNNIRGRLQFHHWGGIKDEWREFTDMFLTSSLHIIMCGRAAWEYDFEESDGGKELVKTGTKMSAEKEMGYEPSLLVEMERLGKRGDVKHVATIIKDRSRTIHGQSFENPTFETFEPFWNFLALGGKHKTLDTSRTSEAMLESPDWSASNLRRDREIAMEDLKGIYEQYELGTGAKDKAVKTAILVSAFGTRSMKEIETRFPSEIRAGVERVEKLLKAATESDPPPTKDTGAWDNWAKAVLGDGVVASATS